MTYYEILGVAPEATPDEIKAAYRKAAKEHHPDREGGDRAKFDAIQAAYDVLSDPDRRRRYDETGEGGKDSASARRADLLNSAVRLVTEIVEGQRNLTAEDVGDKIMHALRQMRGQMDVKLAESDRKAERADILLKRFRLKDAKRPAAERADPSILTQAIEGEKKRHEAQSAKIRETIDFHDELTEIFAAFGYEYQGPTTKPYNEANLLSRNQQILGRW